MRIACVKDLHSRPAIHQKKLFSSHKKGNSQIVLGRFASAHFTKNFLADRKQNVVAARFFADGRNLSHPFRMRRRNGGCLLLKGRSKRCPGDVRLNSFYCSDKTVTAPRKRLDEPRLLVRIAKSAPERLYRCVHAMLKIDKSVRRPQMLLQFFSSEQFAGPFKQQCEDLEWSRREAHLQTVLANLSGVEIDLVGVETNPTLGWNLVAHNRSWEMHTTPRNAGTQPWCS